LGPVQTNATTHNPNDLSMTLGATYSREIAASLARAWENVLDWEHLPHLHDSSFSSLTLEDAGDWGWRALTVGNPATKASKALIELVVDRKKNRYVSRTLRGGIAGMEIWTQFTKVDERRTQVDVEFHIPGMDQASALRLGEYMTGLYKTLWDEDEQMMVERQNALEQRLQTSSKKTINLGPAEELQKRLPLCLEIDGKPVKIIELNGQLTAFRPTCPHMLAPLNEVALDEKGCITCPWHGYKFDVTSGLSTDGHDLALDAAFDFSTNTEGNTLISVAKDATNLQQSQNSR
jgi:nitrite reductase/ring-hydroxylating ferredoxin subunit